MIVVAIAAILVALAVPAYQDYTVRAKVAECIHAAAVPKTQISEFRQVLGYWPPNAQEAGIDQTIRRLRDGLSKYCRLFFYNNSEGDFAIMVNTNAIDPDLRRVQIIPVLSPESSPTGNVDWVCTRGFTDANALKYLPSNCRAENVF